MGTSKRTLAAVAVAGALGVGVTIPALAQSGTEGPTEDATAEATETHRGPLAEYRELFVESLATELGLPVEQVRDALQAVGDELREEVRADRLAALEERLAAAVEDGTLTQEQADAILEAADAGVFPLGGHGRFGHRHGRGPWGRGDGPPFPPPADGSDA